MLLLSFPLLISVYFYKRYYKLKYPIAFKKSEGNEFFLYKWYNIGG